LPVTAFPKGYSLSRALESRRSRREGREDPLNIGQLGSLLYHSARATEVQLARAPDGYDVRRHLYPTGGGMGEIELYLSIHRCDGLAPGFYHYDPVNHCVTRLAAAAPLDIEKLGNAASRAAGRRGQHDLVLLFAARVMRSFWKYEAMAYSMVLRDVGAVTQTLYLVACALGLASCAIGNGDAALFARLAGTDPWTEPLVGELAING
jgi:SagB-type dehydrogenase family enzyme